MAHLKSAAPIKPGVLSCFRFMSESFLYMNHSKPTEYNRLVFSNLVNVIPNCMWSCICQGKIVDMTVSNKLDMAEVIPILIYYSNAQSQVLLLCIITL